MVENAATNGVEGGIFTNSYIVAVINRCNIYDYQCVRYNVNCA